MCMRVYRNQRYGWSALRLAAISASIRSPLASSFSSVRSVSRATLLDGGRRRTIVQQLLARLGDEFDVLRCLKVSISHTADCLETDALSTMASTGHAS